MRSFNATEVAAQLKEQTRELRKKRKMLQGKKRTSKLDRYKFELLGLDNEGASGCELQRWLSQKGVNVQRSTVMRWLVANGAPSAPILDKGLQARGHKAYTEEQFQAVIAGQTPRNWVASLISWETGVRPRELFTIRRNTGRASSCLFQGREASALYEVVQLDGNVRLVPLSQELSAELEQYRLAEPKAIRDRGFMLYQHYFISGGAAWAQSFNDQSKIRLGWSLGVDGVRYSYMVRRLACLQKTMSYKDALREIEREMGGLPYNMKAPRS